MARRRRGLLGDRAGNFATMTALAAPLALMFAGLAVDFGALYLERRHAQSITDIAAISAARDPANAEAIARQVFADNGIIEAISAEIGHAEDAPGAAEEEIEVVAGRYSPDPALAPSERFVPDAAPPNAVRVRLAKPGTRYFSRTIADPPLIGTHAVASAVPRASFSVGSRLARLEGGIANDILGKLLGTELSLSVMDYEALLDAEIGVFETLGALATGIDLTAATYDDVLAGDVALPVLLDTLAGRQGLTLGQRNAARRLAHALPPGAGATVRLSRIFDLGADGAKPVMPEGIGEDATVSYLALVSAVATIAGGTNQVALDLDAGLPGIAQVGLRIAIGEPPVHSAWFALGEQGRMVRTAQTRLLFQIAVAGTGAASLIRLPLYVEIAYAEARIADIVCGSGGTTAPRVTVAARPGIAELQIADIDAARFADFSRDPDRGAATIVNTVLARVTGRAAVDIGDLRFTQLDFDMDDIENGTIKRVATHNVTESLASSLIGNLDIEVKLLGLGIGLPGPIRNAVRNTLSNVTPALDDFLAGVLTALGLSLGEADIRVHSARCGNAVLVQ